MRLRAFQYVEPGSIQVASAFLKEHGHETKISAGGTDLLPFPQKAARPGRGRLEEIAITGTHPTDYNHAQRGCVIMLVLALYVISSEARNLLILTSCRFKIPRLSPWNDITTQSQKARLHGYVKMGFNT
ncbi:MAG: hypothetical protein JRC68_04960 [Deltaproteobacteria bacterium]|nr:hypothetical protein [Deltaproteobacteria bacterium]